MAKRGLFSCIDRALDEEPVFELLARDPAFGRLVRAWADERQAAIRAGDRPHVDMNQVREARNFAEDGEKWRRENLYSWRRHHPLPNLRQVPLNPPTPPTPPDPPAAHAENEANFPKMTI
jgi:hypothetical protein